MKLWKASYEWIREYKPNATATRINGTNDILSVIMKEDSNYILIEFSFVDDILFPVQKTYNLSEEV